MACVFCNRNELEGATFYQEHGWFAFLNSRPQARGHTILARDPLDTGCPEGVTSQTLERVDKPIVDVVDALTKYADPAPEKILLVSLRDSIPHMHFHLIPLWVQEKAKWMDTRPYTKGHLMEFLGDQERYTDYAALMDRDKRRVDDQAQRAEVLAGLQEDLGTLREITGYGGTS